MDFYTKNLISFALKNKVLIKNINKKPAKKLQKKLCFRDFLKKVNFKFEPVDVQLEMVDFFMENSNKTKMILATRGIGKSDLLSIAMPLYKLYLDATYTCLIITKTQSLGLSFIDKMGTIVKDNLELFGATNNNITRTAINLKKTARDDKEKNISFSTRGSNLRGRHPKEIIIDDIVEYSENGMLRSQEQAFSSYFEAMALTENVKIIGQPSNKLDIYSTLRLSLPKGQVMELWNEDVRIPSFLQKDKNMLLKNGNSKEFINANYYGILSDGDVLPFSNITCKDVDFSTLFNVLNTNQVTCYFDFSLGGGDYSAISFVFNYNLQWYAFGFVDKISWSYFIKKYIDFIKLIPNCLVYYEKNSVGFEPQNSMLDYGVVSTAKTTTENKVFKIAKFYGKIDNIILLTIKNCDFMAESLDFYKQVQSYQPNKSKDDAVDSLVMALKTAGFY